MHIEVSQESSGTPLSHFFVVMATNVPLFDAIVKEFAPVLQQKAKKQQKDLKYLKRRTTILRSSFRGFNPSYMRPSSMGIQQGCARIIVD